MTDETADAEGAESGHAVDEPLLARVPEWVVSLGAGALLTSTLLSLGAAVFAAHAITTGRYYGYEPYQIGLATFQFTAVTVFQAVGVYFARKRIRWMWVMLAAIGGALTFIALPFAAVALVCIGVGKYHFALDTPFERLHEREADEADEDGQE